MRSLGLFIICGGFAALSTAPAQAEGLGIWGLFLPTPASASTEMPKSVPAVVVPPAKSMEDFHDITDAWVQALLLDSHGDRDAKFIGKFFADDDPSGLVFSRSGIVIAASEAFHDDSGSWDRFKLTITTNFDPTNKKAVKARRTSIAVEGYLTRNRSTASRPSPKWKFWPGDDERKAEFEIADRLRAKAKVLSGQWLGEITISPTSAQ